MAKIRKDGKAYDGGDVIINALGGVWDEVVEITYDTKQDHQKNYALGSNKAVNWSMGKIEDTGNVKMMMGQASAIEKACGGNMLSIKPFDINVTFTNEFNQVVNDTITCKFQSQGRSVTTDMGLSQSYELFVLDIKYNNL